MTLAYRWPIVSLVVALLVLACAPGAAPAAKPVSAPPATAASAPAAPASQAGASTRLSDAPLNPPVTVRVGTIGSMGDAGIYIGQEKGYYRQQGLELDTTEFQAAQQMIPALGAGHLDVGGGGASAGLINAVALEIPIRIVADRTSMYPGLVSAQ